MKLMVGEIFVAKGRRPLNEDAIASLMASIEKIGLQHPITVREVAFWHDDDAGDQDGAYVLVAGAHRLEACKRLGHFHIDAAVEQWDEDTARMWEISENLHRAELSALERDKEVAEWIALAEKKDQSAQVAPNESKRVDGRGHRKAGGVNAAARELGIERRDAQRAVKVASLSAEASKEAVALGLDDNRSALLAAAKAQAPDEQVEILRARAQRKAQPKLADEPLDDVLVSERQVARLMDAWNAAGADARQEFLLRIGA